MNGFWGGRHEKTFCNVRVFHPHAPTNSNTSLSNCYKRHEREKRNCYEKRIREIEHASFTPLVFSANGSMASGATVFYKCLAALLAQKWDNPYSAIMSWLRCRLVFSLLQSAITCIRGAHSRPEHAIRHSPIPLIRSEA